MLSKLAETLAEGLERSLAFTEHVEQVRQEEEKKHGVPCTIFYQRVRAGEVQPLDSPLVVIVGTIKKARQERILDVGGLRRAGKIDVSNDTSNTGLKLSPVGGNGGQAG